MSEAIIQDVRFDERGLIPAIVQDATSSEILALCYMDNASLVRTLQTGKAEFMKAGAAGAISRRSHQLVDVRVNADGSSITVLVERRGGEEEKPVSLLHDLREAQKAGATGIGLVDQGSLEFGLTITNLYALIADRKEKRPEGSYTTYLFNSGLDKILKKVAEESGEVIIAAKNRSPREIVSELSDLFYHLLVLMVERDVKLSDVRNELSQRASPRKGKAE